MKQRLRMPSPAMVVALLALFVALGGSGTAAVLITGKDIKNGSVRGADVRESSLAKVPNADKLDGKNSSAFALKAVAPFREVGTSGQPAFQNGWGNVAPNASTTAAFYRDPFGVVHLKGTLGGGASGTIIFTLPTGLRPTKIHCMPTVGDARFVCVYADGSVEHSLGATGFLTLDGMTFRAGTG
ncbi:MAG: hypothetical protein ACRDNI_01520 [Gaiellaceae bacterium]